MPENVTVSGRSRAKKLLEDSQKDIQPSENERMIRITVRLDTGFEYSLVKSEAVVRGILDPDVPDCFIEVPCSVLGVVGRYIHTSRIKEIDVHDEVRFKLPG